ncbi:MAG: hypothetical protein MZU84_06940 [Sphingobacterium sp.]|nr:hypothetical protein [Sphingobacterium sp.]
MMQMKPTIRLQMRGRTWSSAAEIRKEVADHRRVRRPEENIKGKPFVGRAGQLLDKILEAGVVNPETDVFNAVTNSVLCLPPAMAANPSVNRPTRRSSTIAPTSTRSSASWVRSLCC